MAEGPFFQSLATIMVVAGLVAVLFSRLKWPKAIGYILAGVLLNGHTWGGSFLADEASVQTIGQLGVVFLMFTMGLEFSVSSIRRIGHVAVPTALLDTVAMVWLGFTIGRSVFGWDAVPSLFLGAAVCDSATTLLAKVIGEMKWGGRPFVKYVLGSSVCEDIVCIGVIALVSGVASGRGMNFASVGTSLGGVALFFAATIFFGLVFVPKVLNAVARRGDGETLLLLLLGCCFCVAYIAYRLDFSLALGAFLVGVLGASSEARARIHELVMPLRSTFAAIFFVSIGLMVDPVGCFRHLPAILLLTVLVMAGKFVNCFLGALLAGGESLKTSVQVGFSMAQIGEFAFMVALLYHSYRGKLQLQHPDWPAEDPLLPIVVGVTFLTTVLNPAMIRLSDRVGDLAERRCPARLAKMLAAYRGFLARYRASGSDARRAAVRANVLRLVLVGVLQFAVLIACVALDACDWSRFSAFFDAHKRIFFCLLANVVLITLLTPVFTVARRLADQVAAAVTGSGEARGQLAIQRVARLVSLAVVISLDFVEIAMINVNLAPREWWARAALFAVLGLAAALGWRFFVRAGHRAAANFREALATDARLAELSREVTFSVPEESVVSLVLPESSPACGLSVGALNIRAKTGAVVVEVVRGGDCRRNIGADFTLAGGDVLTVIADGRQRAELKSLLGVVSE